MCISHNKRNIFSIFFLSALFFKSDAASKLYCSLGKAANSVIVCFVMNVRKDGSQTATAGLGNKVL